MAEYIAYFNGQWVPSDELKIDRADRGFRTGDVVFDSPRTYGGVVFQKERHVDRFLRSLKYARIDPGLSREEISDILDEVVDRNKHHLGEGRRLRRLRLRHARTRPLGRRGRATHSRRRGVSH